MTPALAAATLATLATWLLGWTHPWWVAPVMAGAIAWRAGR